MGDIMNTLCQTQMMDVAWEQNTGSHKLCPIGHITMASPDTAGLGSGQILAELGLMGTEARLQTPRHEERTPGNVFFRLFGFAPFAMQMGYTFSDFEMLKSFHPI